MRNWILYTLHSCSSVGGHRHLAHNKWTNRYSAEGRMASTCQLPCATALSCMLPCVIVVCLGFLPNSIDVLVLFPSGTSISFLHEQTSNIAYKLTHLVEAESSAKTVASRLGPFLFLSGRQIRPTVPCLWAFSACQSSWTCWGRRHGRGRETNNKIIAMRGT